MAAVTFRVKDATAGYSLDRYSTDRRIERSLLENVLLSLRQRYLLCVLAERGVHLRVGSLVGARLAPGGLTD